MILTKTLFSVISDANNSNNHDNKKKIKWKNYKWKTKNKKHKKASFLKIARGYYYYIIIQASWGAWYNSDEYNIIAQ